MILLFDPGELTVVVRGTSSFRDVNTACGLGGESAEQLFLSGGWAYRALKERFSYHTYHPSWSSS